MDAAVANCNFSTTMHMDAEGSTPKHSGFRHIFWTAAQGHGSSAGMSEVKCQNF